MPNNNRQVAYDYMLLLNDVLKTPQFCNWIKQKKADKHGNTTYRPHKKSGISNKFSLSKLGLFDFSTKSKKSLLTVANDLDFDLNNYIFGATQQQINRTKKKADIIKLEKSLHLDSDDTRASLQIKEEFKKELQTAEKNPDFLQN